MCRTGEITFIRRIFNQSLPDVMLIFQGWGGYPPQLFDKCLYLLIFWWGGYPWRPNPCLYNTFTAPNSLTLIGKHFENEL